MNWKKIMQEDIMTTSSIKNEDTFMLPLHDASEL